MPSANHHIFVDQGSTFKLFFEYQTQGNTAIDLSAYSANMQVRKSVNDPLLLLHISGTSGHTGGVPRGVTGGGITGDFAITGGVGGFGGITLNSSSTGATLNGGVNIVVDATTMSNIPSGRHLYDLELITGAEITRIIEGRFEVSPQVSR